MIFNSRSEVAKRRLLKFYTSLKERWCLARRTRLFLQPAAFFMLLAGLVFLQVEALRLSWYWMLIYVPCIGFVSVGAAYWFGNVSKPPVIVNYFWRMMFFVAPFYLTVGLAARGQYLGKIAWGVLLFGSVGGYLICIGHAVAKFFVNKGYSFARWFDIVNEVLITLTFAVMISVVAMEIEQAGGVLKDSVFAEAVMWSRVLLVLSLVRSLHIAVWRSRQLGGVVDADILLNALLYFVVPPLFFIFTALIGGSWMKILDVPALVYIGAVASALVVFLGRVVSVVPPFEQIASSAGQASLGHLYWTYGRFLGAIVAAVLAVQVILG